MTVAFWITSMANGREASPVTHRGASPPALPCVLAWRQDFGCRVDIVTGRAGAS